MVFILRSQDGVPVLFLPPFPTKSKLLISKSTQRISAEDFVFDQIVRGVKPRSGHWSKITPSCSVSP